MEKNQSTTTEQIGPVSSRSNRNTAPAAIADHNTMHQDSSRTQDAPNSFLWHPSGRFESPHIKTPSHSDVFATLASPVFATGAVSKKYTDGGLLIRTDCYLVPRQSPFVSPLPIHTLAFQPIAYESGETSTMLQVLERDSDASATWERSMTEALSAPIGQWRRIWVDQNQHRVSYELFASKMTDSAAYPEFLADVLSAAVCATT